MTSESDVLVAALSQFYETKPAPPEIHLPPASRRARRSRLAGRSRRAARADCRAAARRKEGAAGACGPQRALAYDVRFNAETWPTTRRSRRCARCWRCRRCRGASTASTSRRFRAVRRWRRWSCARTAACASASTRSSGFARRERAAAGPVPRRLRGDASGRPAALPPRARGRWPVSGSDRHRRRQGQLRAAYEALESFGLANLVAIGLAKKEELIFTRDRDEPIALGEVRPGAAAAAADSRRGAPVCGHVPSHGPGQTRPSRRSSTRSRGRRPRRGKRCCGGLAAWPASVAPPGRNSRRNRCQARGRDPPLLCRSLSLAAASSVCPGAPVRCVRWEVRRIAAAHVPSPRTVHLSHSAHLSHPTHLSHPSDTHLSHLVACRT